VRRFADDPQIQAIMRVCRCAGWPDSLAEIGDCTAGSLCNDLRTDEKPTRRLKDAILAARARGTPAKARDVCGSLNVLNLKHLKSMFPDVAETLADKSWAGRVTAGGQS
jgi:hypothetical protein